jgi:hypothetical protein
MELDELEEQARGQADAPEECGLKDQPPLSSSTPSRSPSSPPLLPLGRGQTRMGDIPPTDVTI